MSNCSEENWSLPPPQGTFLRWCSAAELRDVWSYMERAPESKLRYKERNHILNLSVHDPVSFAVADTWLLKYLMKLLTWNTSTPLNVLISMPSGSYIGRLLEDAILEVPFLFAFSYSLSPCSRMWDHLRVLVFYCLLSFVMHCAIFLIGPWRWGVPVPFLELANFFKMNARLLYSRKYILILWFLGHIPWKPWYFIATVIMVISQFAGESLLMYRIFSKWGFFLP